MTPVSLPDDAAKCGTGKWTLWDDFRTLRRLRAGGLSWHEGPAACGARPPATGPESMVDLLAPARVLHEQGDLDAVVDVQLVEQAGDVGLDRRDREVQSCGDLGVGVAAADGEGD